MSLRMLLTLKYCQDAGGVDASLSDGSDQECLPRCFPSCFPTQTCCVYFFSDSSQGITVNFNNDYHQDIASKQVSDKVDLNTMQTMWS